MALAGMIKLDVDALECDFAETYHIYDFRALPARRAALYAAGLRDNSRIKMRISESAVPFEELIWASVTDKLSVIISLLTGGDKPNLLVDQILGPGEKDTLSFDSGADFLAYRDSLINELEKEED